MASILCHYPTANEHIADIESQFNFNFTSGKIEKLTIDFTKLALNGISNDC